jgi:precorrin-6A synthase
VHETRAVRELLVIGIGAGDPDHVTMQAVAALNRAEVFFLVGKGQEKQSLIDVREEILRRHVRTGYRTVEIQDPERDRSPSAGAAQYLTAIEGWHGDRARLFEEAICDNLDEDGVGAFLVWGDPALYDSTLRVIDSVIPGITSIQTLTAAHRLPLNRIGEPIHITTGRRMAAGLPEGLDSAVVMLDAGMAAATLKDPDLYIYWGAYLGTSQEVLRSGRVVDVIEEIAATKRALREQHGWIMDTYLLRRE